MAAWIVQLSTVGTVVSANEAYLINALLEHFSGMTMANWREYITDAKK